jgi:hypothetical protein
MSSSAKGHDSELLPLVRPDNREVVATQQLLDGLWEWYRVLVSLNNAVAGQPLAHGRRVRLVSIWPSEDGKLFTASLRAKERGRSDREFVLYSTSATPATAIKMVLIAAGDEQTAWKEQVRTPNRSTLAGENALPEIL